MERFEVSHPDALAELVVVAGGVEKLVALIAGTLARLEEDGRGAASLEVHDSDAAAIDSLDAATSSTTRARSSASRVSRRRPQPC